LKGPTISFTEVGILKSEGKVAQRGSKTEPVTQEEEKAEEGIKDGRGIWFQT
jgi:hypothetical protein